MLIRAFITERVVNSIQVFDTFQTDFMTTDMFATAVFSDIKTEMDKYQAAFVTTLKNDLFSDIKSTASKYFEIQKLLGNEVPELDTDEEALVELIMMETDSMNKTLPSELRLDSLYHSTSWDEFVFDVLLTEGVYASGNDLESGKLREEEFGSVLGAISAEKYYYEDAGEWVYGAKLVYTGGTTIIAAECRGEEPIVDDSGCDSVKTEGDYKRAKDLLFTSETYQDIISYIFPLKDAVTLLSTYHFSAITDPAVFKATYGGKHVTDLFAETKLTTLQVFLASLYGAGETTYVDPFLEKLKT